MTDTEVSVRNVHKYVGLIPGYDPQRDAGSCVFDAKAAMQPIEFFSNVLEHVKGEKGGQPFTLEPWQIAIVANAFGWRRPDGTRRYRTILIYVPRKNGKSPLVAGIALYVLYCDGEPGAECYCAAANREQAGVVFSYAAGMFGASRALALRAKLYRASKTILMADNVSFFRVISAEADTKHGFNTHFVSIDELHVHDSRDLTDVLTSSMGARRQPLKIFATTADYMRESICNEEYEYACKVRDGVISDPTYLPVIYEALPDDDWTEEAVWRKANPNYDVSVSSEFLREEYRKATERPAYEFTFRRMYLNQRTQSDLKFIDMRRWDACGEAVADEDLADKPCIGGLDLSSNRDVTAFVLYYPHNGAVLAWFWIPEDGAEVRSRRDRVPYLAWQKAGLIEFTTNVIINQKLIVKRIVEISKQHRIMGISVDPWNGMAMMQDLMAEGFRVEEFRMSMMNMNAPTKELERLYCEKLLRHGGNPVLRWMASNVVCEKDHNENLFPKKGKSIGRIDGIVALIMAIGRNMSDPNLCGVDRGLLVLG